MIFIIVNLKLTPLPQCHLIFRWSAGVVSLSISQCHIHFKFQEIDSIDSGLIKVGF